MINNKSISLKPNKGAFFIPSLLISSIISLIPLLALSVIFYNSGIVGAKIFIMFALIFLAIFAITYWLTSIKYRKTSYVLNGDKIIYKTGTIFSDRENELPIRNITHLQLQLPWISHLLFKTGDIRVESAGSNATEGKLFAISNSREIYEKLQEIMKNNGFSMQKKELKEELKPSPLAVVLETLKFVGSVIFAIFYIGASIMSDDKRPDIEINESMINIGIFAGFIVLGIIIFAAILRYLDLQKRVYKVYNDTVEYSEGFLTKNYSLIPFEKLTDSLSTQSFIDKIFGLYDVELSCPGAKREIKFKNIVNGDILAKSVGQLIREFNKTKKKEENPAKKSTNLRVQEFSSFDKSYTAEFHMNKLRAFALPLFIVIFAGILSVFSVELINIAIVAIFSAVSILIKVSSTTYAVSKESIEYHYQFLSSKNISFVNEKITSVVLRESWIDKIFGTCQIHFGSIGASSKIKFMHLKKTEDLYENILAKFGFTAKNPEFELEPKFTIGNYLKSSFIWIIILLIPLLPLFIIPSAEQGMAWQVICSIEVGIILLILLPIFIYMKLYYKNSRVFFYKDYLLVKKGLLVKLQAYANFANIKNITTVKYPLTDAGMVKFDVAGESVTNNNMSQEEQLTKSLVGGQRTVQIQHFSHVLSLSYISEIPLLNDLLDKILEKPMTSTEIVKLSENLAKNSLESEITEEPCLKNYLVAPVVIALLAFFIAFKVSEPSVFMVISIIIAFMFAIIIWNVKMISFEIQNFRVIRRSGIFYKKQVSILYSKIDFISKSAGFFNKIFKNGNIEVNTIGSSKVEMSINNLDNFETVYAKVKGNL